MVDSTTLDALRRAALKRDGTSPVIIWYGPGRSRIELSGATLANAAAKAANLLAEEIEPAELIRLELPLHWQLPVWLAACAAGGWPVEVGPSSGRASLTVTNEVPTITSGRVVLVSLDPFGLPGTPAPPGVIDAAIEARAQPDHFSPVVPPSGRDVALSIGDRQWTSNEMVAAAHGLVVELGLRFGDRLSTQRPATDLRGVLAALWAPLAAGAAAVLLGPGADVELAAQEATSAHVN